MKKLLLLGGSRYLLPVIKAAKELGVYVITADYLPDNIAHKYADEYKNISIVDKEAVLNLAKELSIDGILSYATDPGVTTAAFVAEKMGLPTSPYESVVLLQNKGLFRAFLREKGFNTPYAKCYCEPEDALVDVSNFRFPVIVKPVDSAGSKGVKRVDNKEDIILAAEHALKYSLKGEFIIEEFIEKVGFSTDTDSFSIDGKLVCCSFNNQWFDTESINPYIPAGYTWPSSMPKDKQAELRAEIQRLMCLLKMKTSIYNIETRVGIDGKAYIMECSPRGGGNRLSEVLKLASGQDLIKASVKAALGMPIDEIKTDPTYKGYWGEIILHSNKDGIFKKLTIDHNFKEKYVKEVDLWVELGDEVHSFTGANETIGTLIFHCETEEELTRVMKSIKEMVTVILE